MILMWNIINLVDVNMIDVEFIVRVIKNLNLYSVWKFLRFI